MEDWHTESDLEETLIEEEKPLVEADKEVEEALVEVEKEIISVPQEEEGPQPDSKKEKIPDYYGEEIDGHYYGF